MGTGGELGPPGVAITVAPFGRPAMAVADVGVAGFVGLAARGPLDRPQRVRGWAEFVHGFGAESPGHLAGAVEGFFRAGGRECVVVRVAHAAAPGQAAGPAHAARAERVLVDAWGHPVLRVRARDEGAWGDQIVVALRHVVGAVAVITADIELGAGRASVDHSRGLTVGALARLVGPAGTDWVVLREVQATTVSWDVATPTLRRHPVAGASRLEVVELELVVRRRGEREVWRGLQLDPASPRSVSSVVDEGSRLVAIERVASTTPAPFGLPVEVAGVRLGGGRDGVDHLAPSDLIGDDGGPGQRRGLHALAAIDDVGTLVCPDAMWFVARSPGPLGDQASVAVQQAMIALCERRRDCFALLDGPPGADLARARRWRERFDSSYGAMYWPWLGLARASGRVARLPASGLVAGLIAGCDAERGPHLAPANRALPGVVDLAAAIGEDDLAELAVSGLNPLVDARGIRPWGARTLSREPGWEHLTVRRLFIMLRRSVERGLAWVPFESNQPETWRAAGDQVRGFLARLHQQGCFAGGRAEECYFIRCGAECTPPEALAAGLMICEIGVAPVWPAEFLRIELVHDLGAEV